MSVDESFRVGQCNLKLVVRPSLVDLQVFTEDGAKARRHTRERIDAYFPKVEPRLDLNEVSSRGTQVGNMCICKQDAMLTSQVWPELPEDSPRRGGAGVLRAYVLSYLLVFVSTSGRSPR